MSDERETTPPPNATQAPPARRVGRRTLLVAGAGALATAGAGLAVARAGLFERVERRVLEHVGLTPLPAPHPHPLPAGPLATPHDAVIFAGALAGGWENRSFGDYAVPDTRARWQGQPVMSLVVANYAGLQLVSNPLDTAGYAYLQCQTRGADAGGIVVYLTCMLGDGSHTNAVPLGDYTQGGGIARGAWRLARAPLAALGAVNSVITGVLIQAAGKQYQGRLELADLRLVYFPDLRPPKLLRAWTLDATTLTLAFDEPMDPASAARLAAYRVAPVDAPGVAGGPLALDAARYHPAARTVSLRLAQPLASGATYSVAALGVVDRFGVATAGGTQARAQVTRQPLAVELDVAAERRPISPEIYGMALVAPERAADLGVRLNRWGGNQTTRYNWTLGAAFNAGRDYHFQNGNYDHTTPADRQPSGVADQFIAGNAARGVATLLTIPTIGWVARDDDSTLASQGTPERGGPPLRRNGDAIAGYEPAANRRRVCVPSRARKGAAFSLAPDTSGAGVAQDEWVWHLTQRFGAAGAGSVRYYAMDNEPDLWYMTHTDVRPAELGYEQMRDIFLDYATAVKDVDPTAQITGPVSWGWPGYFFSSLDAGADNYATRAERTAHGGAPFLTWWLAALRAHDARAGRRSLDALDLHFYPQNGVYSDDASAHTAARRLRSTRALWDPTYVDESWIADRVRLIPRMRDWVKASYPGTKLCLSEWNWGAEDSVNGALALAEALGVFGREGLDMACHWAGLDPSQPAYAAFKLFGNYDGAGSGFLGTSFAARSTQYDLLSLFAAQEPATGALLLLAVNKSVDSDLAPALTIRNAGEATVRRARVWRWWPDDPPAGGAAIAREADIALPAADGATLSLRYTFPASSLTLLRLEPGA